MQNLITFESNYLNDNYDKTEDVIASICIDGYPADENEEGTVICEIFITKHSDIVVAWHDNSYRQNDTVKRHIKEATDRLLQLKKER